MTIYRFINDPGHGWLEVPVGELNALGIINAISPYSYQNGRMAYLEEDCDYTTFVLAWEREHGIKWNHEQNTIDTYQDPTPVRNYKHMPDHTRECVVVIR
jgi:hypothetical protein